MKVYMIAYRSHEDEYPEMDQPPPSSWKQMRRNSSASSQIQEADPGSHSKSTETDTPPRQHSAYYSTKDILDDQSEVDADTQARQLRARQRVEVLRARVFRTRRSIRERRTDLRQLQENVKDARAQFMRRIDEVVALGDTLDFDRIRFFHQRLRIAEDELGPAEDEYDNLERRLDDEERDLEEEEDHFYRHNHVPVSNLYDVKIDEALSPIIKPYRPPDSEIDDFSDTNEQVREYVEATKIAEKLKSELEVLESRQSKLVDESTFRRSHGIALSVQETNFLDEFPEKYRVLHDKLLKAERDLDKLRDQCLERGLFTESEYSYEPRDAFSDELLDLVYDTRERSPLTGATHRMHLTKPEGPNFNDKRTYVNRWLMEWVQDSIVETLQLRAWIYFECSHVADEKVKQWPELAIQFWEKDEAGETTNESYQQSRMDAIFGDTRPTETKTSFSNSLASRVVNPGDDGAVEQLIMGSEAGSYTTQREPLAHRPSEHTPTKILRPRSI